MGTVPTIQVRILATGAGPVTINEADFNGDLHERWVHMRAPEAAALEAPAPPAEPEAPAPAKAEKPGKRKG